MADYKKGVNKAFSLPQAEIITYNFGFVKFHLKKPPKITPFVI